MRHPTPAGDRYLWYFANGDRSMLAFITGDGTAIDIGWQNPPDVSREEVQNIAVNFFLANMLGLAVRLRGQPVLHGNAVQVGNHAIAWVGEKGAGKSTLAAAFVRAGYQLLSDDQVALWPVAGGWGIAHGVLRLRLWPTSLPALDDAADESLLELPLGEQVKGYVRVPQVPQGASEHPPLRLHSLYVLQPRGDALPAAAMTELTARERFHALITHTLGRRVLPMHDRSLQEEFQQWGEVGPHLRVRALQLPDDLAKLPQVVETLAAQVATTPHAMQAGHVSPR